MYLLNEKWKVFCQ